MNSQGDERKLLSHKGKVFDIVRPGQTLATPTSRPVIPVHNPEVKDAQFVEVPAPQPAPVDSVAMPQQRDIVAVEPEEAAAFDASQQPAEQPSSILPTPTAPESITQDTAPVNDTTVPAQATEEAPTAVVAHIRSPKKPAVLKLILILLLLILLAAIALNFMLDAGLIDLPINIPHTNLL